MSLFVDSPSADSIKDSGSREDCKVFQKKLGFLRLEEVNDVGVGVLPVGHEIPSFTLVRGRASDSLLQEGTLELL